MKDRERLEVPARCKGLGGTVGRGLHVVAARVRETAQEQQASCIQEILGDLPSGVVVDEMEKRAGRLGDGDV